MSQRVLSYPTSQNSWSPAVTPRNARISPEESKLVVICVLCFQNRIGAANQRIGIQQKLLKSHHFFTDKGEKQANNRLLRAGLARVITARTAGTSLLLTRYDYVFNYLRGKISRGQTLYKFVTHSCSYHSLFPGPPTPSIKSVHKPLKQQQSDLLVRDFWCTSQRS